MTRKKRERTYINRELSWLSFNGRVLQEAEDPAVPLAERLNFLAIFSSNLDEFFRVRVASLRSLLRLKRKRVEALGLSPGDVLRDLHGLVTEQQARFGEIFRNDIVPALERHGILLLGERDLNARQVAAVRVVFDERVAPRLDPVVFDGSGPVPFLQNRESYLVVELWPHEGRGVATVTPRYALVNVPSPPLPRFLSMDTENGRHAVIFLDDVIRLNLARLFPAFEVGGAYAVKLSRDAELYLEDEFAGNIVDSIRKSLKKRETGMPCRFLYDLQASRPLVAELEQRIGLEPEDLVPGGRYHNLHDLADLPRFGIPELSYAPSPPLPHPELDGAPSMLAAIAERDRMLHFPYHRFGYVIRLLEEAARDPDVEDISITLYRVARDSAIAETLIRAAEAGKRVTAFIELKARFDEESNLSWAERMERAGVRTLFSMPRLKVHAKLALITRREDGEPRSYAFLGTGNFNERTALVYADTALLTADPRLTVEVRRVFAFLSGENRHPEFKHLFVAPFNMRKRFYRRIEREAEAARRGKPAGIILKLNSLEDRKIIDRLYDASVAGVDIRMVVRGICCLVPGEPGQSETIRAHSIVDRFLEHARIFIFENRGKPLTYLSSADWMSRNLSRRVEVAFPIFDPELQAEIRAMIDFQLADNQKARILDAAQRNRYVRAPGERPVRSQIEMYRFLRSRLAARPAATPAPDRPHTQAKAAHP